MIAPLSKKVLLAAAAAATLLPVSHAGLLNPQLDLQTYRDYAENRGVFRAGATNVTVYNADGSVNGVIAQVPDFAMVADIGAVTLIGGSFGGSVAHYGTVMNGATFATRFNDTGLAYSYFGDAYHPIVALSPGNDVGMIRYSKLVIDASPTTLVTDPTLLTSMTGKEITRVGSGRQSWATAPGVEAAAAPPGYSSYNWTTGGFNKIDSMGTSAVTDNVNDGVTKTYQGYRYSYNMDAVPATKMQIGTQDGDSGSPVFVWNPNTSKYEVIAFNSSGSGAGIGKGTNIVSAPQWMLDMMASYNMPTVSATAGGGVVTMGVTNASGAGTLTQGATIWNYIGLASGTTSATATDAQFEATRNLVFAGAGNTIRIAGNIDTGAGTMQFTSGSYSIDDGGVTTRRLNTAGYIVDSGATLTLRTTGSAGDDWRKTGAGTLAIEGSGNSDAKLSLGEGLVTLNRSGGYAVDDVLITSGRGTVRLLAANQINGDISFGHLGGTLDIYGTSLSRATIYAMDTGAVITNTKANTTSTFTWTGSGSGLTQTFRGGFVDGGSLANGLLNVVIAPGTPSGAVLTLTGESTNAGGYSINGGEVVLRGYNTPHAGDGAVASAPPAVPTPNDWTYASIATGTITVASGSKFTFADHARLDGNVAVNAGGTFAITENLFKSTAESVEGALPGTPSTSLYGHQSGAVTLSGATAAMMATISGATDQNVNYSRDISGTGSFTKNGAGTLTLSGTNTFSGAKAVNAGALIGASLGALGDTTTNKWAVAASGVIAASGATAAQTKAKVTTTSAGTLALAGSNPDAAPDMTGYSGLYLGAIGAQTVGTLGTSSALTAWNGAGWNLGGGGGALTMNLKLSGSGTLNVGNGVNTGTVVLTNVNNATTTGGAAFTGTINIAQGVELKATSSAALGTFSGADRIAVAYGARFGIGTGSDATTLFNAVTTGSQGVLKISGTDTNAYSFTGQGLNSAALGADGTATYSGVLTPGTSGYRFGGDGNLTVTSVLSGSNALSADGQGASGGVTTLSGNNTFAGAVTVQGGVVNGATGAHTLRAGSNTAFGTGNALVLNDGGRLDLNGATIAAGTLTGTAASALTNGSATAATLTLNESSSTTMGGAISGAVALVKNGSGTLTLSGVNTQTGAITVNTGSLKVGSTKALGAAGNVVGVASGATLDLNGKLLGAGTAATVTGSGSGAGAIINSSTAKGSIASLTLASDTTFNYASGAGKIILGADDNSGVLNLAGYTLTKNGTGTLIFNGLKSTGAGNIVVNAGALQLTDDYGDGHQQAVSLTGSGSITLNSGGTLLLQRWSPALTLSMNLVLNGGTLGSNWSGPNGATVASNIAVTANSALTFNGGYGSVTLAGVISGAGGLTIGGDGATRTFSGANTYAGDTTVNAGTLQLSNALALQNSTLATGRIGFDSAVASHDFTFGGLKGSGNIALVDTGANAVALTVGGNNQSTIYSGVLSDTGSLTKAGSGTLTLSGANTYAGGTTVNAGTLALGNASALGSASANVTVNAGTLDLGAFAISTGAVTLSGGTIQNGTLTGASYTTNSGTIAATLAGAGSLTKQTSGTLTLSGANTYSGGTTLAAGTIRVANSDAALGTGALNVTGSSTLATALGGGARTLANIVAITSGTTLSLDGGYADLTLSGTVSGTGNLAAVSTGSVVLTGNNTYAGTTSVASGGTLSIGSGGASGSLGGGAVTTGGSLVFNRSDAVTVANAISGAGSVTQAGTGALTLTGTNTFSGGVTIAQATLNAGVGSLGSGAITVGAAAEYGATYASGGAPFLNVTDTGNATLANAIVLTDPASTGYFALRKAGAGSSLTLGGVISGGGANTVLQLDTGTGGDSTTNFTLAGNNTFAGQLRLNRGTLTLANANAAGASTIFLQSNSNANGNLIFASGFTLNNAVTFGSTANNNVSTGANDVTLSGVVTSSVAWQKVNGAGKLVLAADNAITGTITVADGTLQIGAGGTTGSLGGTAGIVNNAALAFNRSNFVTIANAVSGSGALSFLGTGVSGQSGYTLTGDNSAFSGAVTVSNSRLVGDNTSGNRFGTGTLATGTNGQLWLNGGTFANALTLSGNGWQEGAGQLGAIRFGNGAVASGAITLAGATRIGAYGSSGTVSGVISGANALEIGGAGALAGTVTLTAANTYTGGTTVTSGTLQLGNSATTDYGSTGRIRGALTANAGTTILLNGSNALGWSSGAKVDTINLLGATLTHAGNGDNGWGVVYNLTGATMQATGAGQFSFGNNTAVNTLASATATTIAGNVVLRESNTNNTTVFTVADGAAASDLNVTGTISSGGAARGVTKSGSGLMTLSGANTYAGATTVNAGTLLAGSNSAFGTGAVTVNSGGTANLGGRTLANAFTVNSGGFLAGAGAVSGAVSVASGGRLAPGTAAAAAIQTFSGGVTLASGAIYVWDLLNASPATAGTDFDKIVISAGTLAVNSGAILKIASSIDYSGAFWDSVHAFTVAGKSGTGTITGAFGSVDTSSAGAFSGQGAWSVLTSGTGELQALWTPGSSIESPQAVPEPSTYGLLGAGALAGVAIVRRWKRKVA